MAVFTGNGSNTAPSFTFSSDTDTGFYRDSDGRVAYTTNGSASLYFGSGLTISNYPNDGFSNLEYRVGNYGNNQPPRGLILKHVTTTAAAGAAYLSGIVAETNAGGNPLLSLVSFKDVTAGAQTFQKALTVIGSTASQVIDFYGGDDSAIDMRLTDSGSLVIGGTIPTAPRTVLNQNGYNYASSRFTAPQIGASDYDNFDNQTATSSAQYAVVTKNFSYTDTVNFLDVVRIGQRGSFKITVAGDDASDGQYGIHISESYVVCSNNYILNAAPDVKINAGGRGLDVQWKASGAGFSGSADHRTLQVRPQHIAANFFTVTVEVFSRYALSTASVEFNP